MPIRIASSEQGQLQSQNGGFDMHRIRAFILGTIIGAAAKPAYEFARKKNPQFAAKIDKTVERVTESEAAPTVPAARTTPVAPSARTTSPTPPATGSFIPPQV